MAAPVPGANPPRPAEVPRREPTPQALGVAIFCVVTVVYLIVRDLFVPHARMTEVWLGFELTGPWARITAPLHWALFAVGAWAFGTGRSWAWRAGMLYAGYIAVSHFVWNQVSPAGGGLLAGIWQFALFLVPAALLQRLRPATRHDASSPD